MASMTLMELRRQLENANIDKRHVHFFAELYEHQIALENTFDELQDVVLQLAKSMERFVQLNETTQQRLQEVLKRGKIDGVDVRSVPIGDDLDS